LKEIYELEIDGSENRSDNNSTSNAIKKTLEDAGFKCRVRFKSNRSFEEQSEYDLWESHMAAG
jgi:hypothetical protein